MQRAGKSRKILGPRAELAQTSFFGSVLSPKKASLQDLTLGGFSATIFGHTRESLLLCFT